MNIELGFCVVDASTKNRQRIFLGDTYITDNVVTVQKAILITEEVIDAMLITEKGNNDDLSVLYLRGAVYVPFDRSVIAVANVGNWYGYYE